MIIEIPKNYRFNKDKDPTNYAYEKKGNLIIVGRISFETLMYDLIKKINTNKRCFYCNCKLSKKSVTIDHKIPVSFGGITIPPNTVLACKSCNEQKSNLTSEQYLVLKNVINEKPESKKETLNDLLNQNEIKLEKYGYSLPLSWITFQKRFRIMAEVYLGDDEYKGKRYKKIKAFYKKYHHLPRPIIISKNNVLLDGFLILMFAKNKGIKKVPVIVLENVIVR